VTKRRREPNPGREAAHRPVQFFSDEYLARCRTMTHEERLAFLESFRLLNEPDRSRSRLISLKVAENLLDAFRRKCAIAGVPYQTQIKRLMTAWLDLPSC
jgi:hypothetical protein